MTPDIVSATALVVAGYAARNHTDPDLVADLIPKVASALISTGAMNIIAEEAERSEAVFIRPPANDPAVPITDSIQDDCLICLEDGTRHTALKRYLRNRFGLSPEQYRARWELPKDYPMVAPAYSQKRREIAQRNKRF